MGIHVIRFDRLRDLEAANGFLMAVEIAQRHAEIIVCVGMIRLDGERLHVARPCLLVAAEHLQGVAYVVMRSA